MVDLQVKDNFQLLETMLKDIEVAPEIYRPTNYWSVYAKRFIPELKKHGLCDFRRRKSSVLSSFGATDMSPFYKIDLCDSRLVNSITKNIPFWSRFLSKINSLLKEALPFSVSSGVDLNELKKVLYEWVCLQGNMAGAKSIKDFEVSVVGNPEDIIKIGEKSYTISIMYYYLRYVYCSNYVNFENVKIMVELGCGSGKQIEVLKKLYPDITFLLFDIPPQLYVCEQYLSTVFPDSVVSYTDTRKLDFIPPLEKGKIYFFGNWKFPILSELEIDLFWNAASFQEMEPKVVENYLKYINKQAKNVFLQQNMDGKEIAVKKGTHGVLKQTKLADYKKGLPNFDVVNITKSKTPVGLLNGYHDSFWKRKIVNL